MDYRCDVTNFEEKGEKNNVRELVETTQCVGFNRSMVDLGKLVDEYQEIGESS